MALPGTGAAQAGSLSGARRNSCPGGGEAPARERSPDVVWQGARVALRVLGAAGPGLPRDAALSVCLAPPPTRGREPERSREWPVRPAERARVRGQRVPGFGLAPRLNCPRRD